MLFEREAMFVQIERKADGLSSLAFWLEQRFLGKFSLFGGSIEGKFTELVLKSCRRLMSIFFFQVPDKTIKMQWRFVTSFFWALEQKPIGSRIGLRMCKSLLFPENCSLHLPAFNLILGFSGIATL